MDNRNRIPRKDFIKLLGFGGASVLLGPLLNSFGNLELNKFIPHVMSGASATYKDEDSLSYIIEKHGSYTHAKNARTGNILISSTNSTAVIQAAINNLTPGRTFPELVKIDGNYILDKIKIASYTTLDCRNTKLTLRNGVNDYFLTNSDIIRGNTQINIIGGIIDGNKSYNTQEGTLNTIHFEKVTDSQIQNVHIENASGHAIRLDACNNVRIVAPVVKNSRKGGVSIIRGGQNSCLNGYFYNTGWSFISTLNSTDAIISRNYGDTTADATSGITPNGLRNIVSRNIILNAGGSAIPMAQINTSDYDASGSVISENIIWKPLKNGITCVNYPVTDLLISNNVIIGGDGPRADITAQGICLGAAVKGFKNIIVDGNIVRDFQSSGIRVSIISPGSITMVRIERNIVSNNGKALGSPGAHRYGIVILGESTDITLLRNIAVVNNTVYDTSAERGQNYGVYFRSTADCMIIDNSLHNNVIAGILSQNNQALEIRNNEGYKTENSGSVTIQDGETKMHVTHGLSVTPSINDIYVTPSNNIGNATKFWVSSVTPRNFTVNVDQEPGPMTAKFVWQIGQVIKRI